MKIEQARRILRGREPSYASFDRQRWEYARAYVEGWDKCLAFMRTIPPVVVVQDPPGKEKV
jgi:hypothetical protein